MEDKLSAWLQTTIGQYAASYAKTSYVLPLHGITADLKCTCNTDCKSPGKHPYTRNGLKDASNNIEEIARLFNYREDLNIGLLTGEKSGFFVLDIDPKREGGTSLIELIKKYEEFPPTTEVATGGNGFHVYFNYPVGINIGNRTDFMPGLDIRGNGGYVVGAPSKHISGKQYKPTEKSIERSANAPQWLIDMVRVKKEKIEPVDPKSTSGSIPEWSVDEVYRMLDALDPSMSYEPWIQIGMGIHDGGFPYEVWNSWSSKGTNYTPNCCAPHWRSFKTNGGVSMGTLVQMAQLAGWKPAMPEKEVIDTSSVEPLVKKAKEMLKEVKSPKQKPPVIAGINALEVPGLIGDTVRWITKHAIRRQPELALINTLAFAGSVFGRRYASPRNTRTNLYMVGIADTGSGKDHSRKAIRELAHAAGLDQRIGADAIRSDSGLLRSLMNNSSQLMMIDEFGYFLQAISNDKAPHYVRSQVEALLKLYSSSNSVYNHGDYADAKLEPIVIECPNLCIYGTSTEEKYAKSLKRSAVESGELNRFITIKGRMDVQYPDKVMPEYEMDKSLVERWSQFSPQFGDSIGLLVNNSDIAPEPVRIPWGGCDEIQHAIHCRQIDKTSEDSPMRHLWGRLYENTIKIAMIFAIARDKHAPQFEPEDFNLAQIIVESSIEYLTNLARHNMSETPQEEGNNEIMKAIIEAGGKMGRRDIMRQFRKLKKRELDEILVGLIEQEMIDVEKVADGRGRPTTYYKLLKQD